MYIYSCLIWGVIFHRYKSVQIFHIKCDTFTQVKSLSNHKDKGNGSSDSYRQTYEPFSLATQNYVTKSKTSWSTNTKWKLWYKLNEPFLYSPNNIHESSPNWMKCIYFLLKHYMTFTHVNLNGENTCWIQKEVSRISNSNQKQKIFSAAWKKKPH